MRPFYSGCVRIACLLWCLLEQGGPIATEQGVRARDPEHSFGVSLELGASRWVCCRNRAAPRVTFMSPYSPAYLLVLLWNRGSPWPWGLWGCLQMASARGGEVGSDRLEDKLRALGHCPVGSLTVGHKGRRRWAAEPLRRGVGAQVGHALYSLHFASGRVNSG